MIIQNPLLLRYYFSLPAIAFLHHLIRKKKNQTNKRITSSHVVVDSNIQNNTPRLMILQNLDNTWRQCPRTLGGGLVDYRKTLTNNQPQFQFPNHVIKLRTISHPTSMPRTCPQQHEPFAISSPEPPLMTSKPPYPPPVSTLRRNASRKSSGCLTITPRRLSSSSGGPGASRSTRPMPGT